jgi:two-component system response regulator YesN
VIKLVIVDDEKMIRDGLALTINWAEYHIEVVGVAKDGLQALEICRQVKPHIVLTDIRMPKMNGIELIQALKEEMSQIKVIILSGYDEFSYAQRALQYGAVDYLIKPIDIKELEQVIMRVRQNFEQELFGELLHIKRYQEIEPMIAPYFNAVRIGRAQEAVFNLKTVMKQLETKPITLKNYKKVMIHMIANIEKALYEDGYHLKDAGLEIYNHRESALIHFNLKEELKEWLYDFTEALCEWVEGQKEEGGSHRALIKKAMTYMEFHYDEDLTVESIAEVVALSSNYFSHIFKKTRGESFTDYLNKVRIEAAKNYLIKEHYKIYEVAYKVGYKDYKYFSSVFKKHVGISPTKYCELAK